MTPELLGPRARLLTLLLLIGVIAWLGVSRLQISYDLGAFLPAAQNPTEALLLERLGQGPGAQTLFVKLTASDPAAAAQMAERLRTVAGVQRVLPEPQRLGIAAIPQIIWQHRLLLQDLPADSAAWQVALSQRMDELAFGADQDMLALVAADPALMAVNTLADAAGELQMPWFDQGATQVLIVQTSVSAYDPGRLAQVVAELRAQLPSEAQLLGAPAYAVDLQDTVRNESTLFSILASLALLGLIIWRFRAWYPVIGVGVPLLAGGVTGILVLTLFYAEVHGITLAFGFTLLGIVIDYPLHLFTHMRMSQEPLKQTVWPVLRVGIVSTLIAYGAFVFSGSQGLEQLGVLACSGILAAALAAAWIAHGDAGLRYPAALPDVAPTVVEAATSLRMLPATLLFITSGLILWLVPVFNDDLGSLTPVDPDLLAEDARLRRSLGTVDMRYVVAIRDAQLEGVLQKTEHLVDKLDDLYVTLLRGWQAITQTLPSAARQQARLERLTDPASRKEFAAAIQAAGLQQDAFTAFENAWQQQLEAPGSLTWEDLEQSSELAAPTSLLLLKDDAGWVSVTLLRGLASPERLRGVLPPGAQLHDLKATAEGLVKRYRQDLSLVLGVALVLLALLLGMALSVRRMLWLLISGGACVCGAAAVSAILQGGLSLFDLMALTLVAGLGLDYLLFYSSPQADAADGAVASAVGLCAASSFLVFGILGISSIPVLRGIGTTVAVGVVLAFLLARYGRQAKAAR